MNYHLKQYVFRIKGECLKLGFPIKINESGQDTVALLSNPRSDRIVMVSIAANVFGDVLIKAYLVNRPKYEWALAEGFSLDEMVGLVKENVFIEVDPSKVSSYLL